MRPPSLHSLLSRLLLALALIAPHPAAAEAARGGLVLVICGAAGPYEIALDVGGGSPVHAAPHDCCIACAPVAAAAPGTASTPSPRPVASVAPPAGFRAPGLAHALPGRPRAPPPLV